MLVNSQLIFFFPRLIPKRANTKIHKTIYLRIDDRHNIYSSTIITRMISLKRKK
jgi:hypothetical protein